MSRSVEKLKRRPKCIVEIRPHNVFDEGETIAPVGTRESGVDQAFVNREADYGLEVDRTRLASPQL